MRRHASTLPDFLRPFGDGDGNGDGNGGKGGNGNDSANKGGSQGQGDNGQSSRAGGEKPVTLEAIRGLLDERLNPLEKEVKSFGNFRGQVSRHLKIGGSRNDDDGDDDGDNAAGAKSSKKTDAEKKEGAAARRLQELEDRANKAQIKADLGEALAQHAAGLVPGAREKIERLVRGGLRVVEGRTVYDTGDELLDLAEVVKKEASDPLFRPASSKGSGGGSKGETEPGSKKSASSFEDVDVENMTDEEFDNFRKKSKLGR